MNDEISQDPNDYPEPIRHVLQSALSMEGLRLTRVDYDPEGGIANRGHLYIEVSAPLGGCYNSGSGHTSDEGKFKWYDRISGPIGPSNDVGFFLTVPGE